MACFSCAVSAAVWGEPACEAMRMPGWSASATVWIAESARTRYVCGRSTNGEVRSATVAALGLRGRMPTSHAPDWAASIVPPGSG